MREVLDTLRKRGAVIVCHRDGDGIGSAGILLCKLASMDKNPKEKLLDYFEGEFIKIYSTPWGCFPPPGKEEEFYRDIESSRNVIILDQMPFNEKLIEILEGKDVLIIDHHGNNYPENVREEILRRFKVINPAIFGEPSQLRNASTSMIVRSSVKVSEELEMLSDFLMLLGAYCDWTTDHRMVVEVFRKYSLFEEFRRNNIFRDLNSLISKMVYLSRVLHIQPEVILKVLFTLYNNNDLSTSNLEKILSNECGEVEAGRILNGVHNTWGEYSKKIRERMLDLSKLSVIFVRENLGVIFYAKDLTRSLEDLTMIEDLSRYYANYIMYKVRENMRWLRYRKPAFKYAVGVVAAVYNGKDLQITGRSYNIDAYNVGEHMANVARMVSEKYLKERAVVTGGGHPGAGGMKAYDIGGKAIEELITPENHLRISTLEDIIRKGYRIERYREIEIQRKSSRRFPLLFKI